MMPPRLAPALAFASLLPATLMLSPAALADFKRCYYVADRADPNADTRDPKCQPVYDVDDCVRKMHDDFKTTIEARNECVRMIAMPDSAHRQAAFFAFLPMTGGFASGTRGAYGGFGSLRLESFALDGSYEDFTAIYFQARDQQPSILNITTLDARVLFPLNNYWGFGGHLTGCEFQWVQYNDTNIRWIELEPALRYRRLDTIVIAQSGIALDQLAGAAWQPVRAIESSQLSVDWMPIHGQWEAGARVRFEEALHPAQIYRLEAHATLRWFLSEPVGASLDLMAGYAGGDRTMGLLDLQQGWTVLARLGVVFRGFEAGPARVTSFHDPEL